MVQTIFPGSPSAPDPRGTRRSPCTGTSTEPCPVLAALVARPLPETSDAAGARKAPARDTSYDGARALLAAAGVAFAPSRTVHDARTSCGAALADNELPPYPVVLKALGRLHKSEGGGVVLGLAQPRPRRRRPTATWLPVWDRRPCRSRR